MGWGVHVFEEPVLERPYWVLGLGVVVSHFAAVKAEVQRGTGKDLRPSALGVSAAARQSPQGIQCALCGDYCPHHPLHP